VLENVKLGARLERRTINTLNPSQHARLQLAVALLQAPDVLLLDQPTVTNSGPLSHDDVQDLTDFVSNFPKTCVVNSTDEDFLNSFTDTVLHIDSNGSVEKLTGSYAAAKQVIETRARAAMSEAMEEKYRSKPGSDADK
jgi:ATPase subunit of ABC transporter with duplicated ATPase domains